MVTQHPVILTAIEEKSGFVVDQMENIGKVIKDLYELIKAITIQEH